MKAQIFILIAIIAVFSGCLDSQSITDQLTASYNKMESFEADYYKYVFTPLQPNDTINPMPNETVIPDVAEHIIMVNKILQRKEWLPPSTQAGIADIYNGTNFIRVDYNTMEARVIDRQVEPYVPDFGELVRQAEKEAYITVEYDSVNSTIPKAINMTKKDSPIFKYYDKIRIEMLNSYLFPEKIWYYYTYNDSDEFAFDGMVTLEYYKNVKINNKNSTNADNFRIDHSLFTVKFGELLPNETIGS